MRLVACPPRFYFGPTRRSSAALAMGGVKLLLPLGGRPEVVRLQAEGLGIPVTGKGILRVQWLEAGGVGLGGRGADGNGQRREK